jgi:hypothetical protein
LLIRIVSCGIDGVIDDLDLINDYDANVEENPE